MNQSREPTPKNKIKFRSIDPLSGEYSFRYGEEVFCLRGRGDIFSIRTLNHQEVGQIRRSLDCGSIWINGKRIGDYERTRMGYIIIPYKDGRKEVDKKIKDHPLKYLVENAEVASREGEDRTSRQID